MLSKTPRLKYIGFSVKRGHAMINTKGEAITLCEEQCPCQFCFAKLSSGPQRGKASITDQCSFILQLPQPATSTDPGPGAAVSAQCISFLYISVPLSLSPKTLSSPHPPCISPLHFPLASSPCFIYPTAIFLSQLPYAVSLHYFPTHFPHFPT